MSRLEKRKYDPLAGAGQWATKRTGQWLDAASRVATSDGLIAPGCHWSIPALRGVPTEYQFFGGLNAAARLAKSLVTSDVAQADVWFRAGRDPFRFIEQTLKDSIEAHGGQEIDQVLAAAGKGAILAGQQGPRRQCSVAATGHQPQELVSKEKMVTGRRKHSRPPQAEKNRTSEK